MKFFMKGGIDTNISLVLNDMYKDNRIISLDKEEKEKLGDLREAFIELYNEAYDSIDKKDLYTTLQCIRKLKEIDNENIDVMVLEAEYYENRNNMQKALEKISDVIDKDDENALAYYLRGRYKTNMGKLEGAYDDIRKAITLDKDNYEYKSVLAKIYLDLGNYDYARNLYEKIIHVYKTKEVRDCFVSANKFLIEDINEIPKDEINIEEKMSLIKSHLLLGQLEEAYEIIKPMAGTTGSVENSLYLGKIFMQMHEDAKAMPYFDIIIQIGIKDPEAFVFKGNLLERKGDYQGAYDNYEKALKYNPDCVWIYNNIASALIGLEKYDEALEYTDKSLRENYDKEISYNNKGKIFYGNGKKDVALKYYDLSIKEVPNFADAHVNKIKLLLELRKKEDALSACDEAIECDVKDYRVFIEKATILKDMGNYEEAVKYADEAIKYNKNSVRAYFIKAISLCKMVYYSAAMENIDKAIEVSEGKDLVAYGAKLYICNEMREKNKFVSTCMEAIGEQNSAGKKPMEFVNKFKNEMEKCNSELKEDVIYKDILSVISSFSV